MTGGKAFLAAIRRIHDGNFDVEVVHVVALDPGPEITVGHVVFKSAGAEAASAAYALGNVKQHAPPVFRGIVGRGGFWSPREDKFPSGGRGRKKDKELASGDCHFLVPWTKPGLCG